MRERQKDTNRLPHTMIHSWFQLTQIMGTCTCHAQGGTRTPIQDLSHLGVLVPPLCHCLASNLIIEASLLQILGPRMVPGLVISFHKMVANFI